MTAFKRVPYLFLLLLLALSSLGLNVQTASAAPAACTQYYTVQRGDYLVKIARLFNVSWRYLAEINDLADPTRLFAGQKLCVSTSGTSTGGSSSNSGSAPRVLAVEVVEDKTVTLQGRNLPANARFDVLLARYSLSSTTSLKVGVAYSDKNGNLSVTLNIPRSLRDIHQINVYLNRGTTVIADNWFYNQTSKGNTGGDNVNTGNLSIQVVDVVGGHEVSISGRDFPTRTRFDVSMAERSASKVKWIYVTTIYIGTKGAFDETFAIPQALVNAGQISILVESQDGKYDASTWFYNRAQYTTPDDAYLTPVEVVKNEEVTIKFSNLQAGVKYTVLMGEMGTKAENGIIVGTVQASRGGALIQSFTIPAALRGDTRIAIRMENSKGFFAYNWFTNQTTY